MKTLKNHLILFDAECPMCRTYTKIFVKSGMLAADGRASYQELPPQACPMLDRQRAVNEIALVNQETGEVTYGVESLFKVIAASFPVLKPLLLFRPFVWLMTKFYAFIAFNRRVIIPAPAVADKFELQPTFRLNYRIAYLVATGILSAFMLSSYVGLMKDVLPAGNAYRVYLVGGGQLLFQGVIISIVDKDKRWDYLGNMMTVFFAGSLLLLPALLLAQWLNFAATFYAAWLFIVAALMLLEHIRRCRLLEINWVLTITWIIYYVLVLLFINIAI